MASLPFKGLSDHEVTVNRKNYGSNILGIREQSGFIYAFKEVVMEPLFILLLFTSLIYFGVGKTQEGLIMVLALLFVSGISLYQERRSRNAVNSLKKLTSPRSRAIRNGSWTEVETDDLVMDDIFYISDGNLIPADGIIQMQHDLSVDESILTGESFAVMKQQEGENNRVFRGTNVVSGSAYVKVTAVGTKSELGKIGLSLESISREKTPLQKQITIFTTRMVVFGVAAFLVVCVMTFVETREILESLLKGLTLAMSVLPEEIPVAFSTFMALGAYHLYRKGIITKAPSMVETLGGATVICTDKTGTLTQNRMELALIYDYARDTIYDCTEENANFIEVLEIAMWASEPEPFDKMEVSLHDMYGKYTLYDEREDAVMVAEYPLDGKPPIMTHAFRVPSRGIIVAAKGGVETILHQCSLPSDHNELIMCQVFSLASQGYRVLGVASALWPEGRKFPDTQSEFVFEFQGLVAFYDPPKTNIRETVGAFYNAGIQVKMITGDYAQTASAIAAMCGIQDPDRQIEGVDIMNKTDEELRPLVGKVNIFSRMFPEAKMRVIELLKSNGEVVAMTGDGVNDGPALKSAHIGIAMGVAGSEVARNAASLVIMDDDLKWMVYAIGLGRRIYENLKKAFRYIISIHIPVLLIVSVPVVLTWKYINLFTPVHVIFLELIMGPTCSIVFENEPIERNSMMRPPRKSNEELFSLREMTVSIIQGLVITLACLGAGYYVMTSGASEAYTRTVIYVTLIFANIFLTLVNRSFVFSALETIRYRNPLMAVILVITLVILFVSVYFEPSRRIFGFEVLSQGVMGCCALLAFVSVAWLEIYKWVERRQRGVE